MNRLHKKSNNCNTHCILYKFLGGLHGFLMDLHWISNDNTGKKKSHIITKMNENINMESKIVGSVNDCS